MPKNVYLFVFVFVFVLVLVFVFSILNSHRHVPHPHQVKDDKHMTHSAAIGVLEHGEHIEDNDVEGDVGGGGVHQHIEDSSTYQHIEDNYGEGGLRQFLT